MTLDDLTKIYRDEIALPQYPGWDEKNRAGIAAVVTTLQKHFAGSWDDVELFDAFNEILGEPEAKNGDIAQRIEHGDSTSGVAGSTPAVPTSPAVDLPRDEEHFGVAVGKEFPAADAVCVWRMHTEWEKAGWNFISACDDEFRWVPKSGICPNSNCGKPIQFKEPL